MLYLAGAAGLSRSPDPAGSSRLSSAVLGATGVGLLGSAAFRTDPVSGYPPGTPDAPTKNTATGAMHTVAALSVSMLTTMDLAGAGFSQAPRLVNLAGLFQRRHRHRIRMTHRPI
jgi:hypothetical protein